MRGAKTLCWQAAQTRGYIPQLMKGFARICKEDSEKETERKTTLLDRYIEEELEADGLEELYAEAHSQIREDPFKKDEDEGEKKPKEHWIAESKKYRQKKLSKEEKPNLRNEADITAAMNRTR